MTRALLLAGLCLIASFGNVCARTYNVYATGEAPARSPEHWGIAFSMGNEESNTLQMLDYLSPTYLRIFIQPLSGLKWRSFVANKYRDGGNWSNQYGLDFSGNAVVDMDTYQNAVNSLRSGPGNGAFFDWLDQNNQVDWPMLLKRLSTTDEGVSGAYGNPDRYIKDLQNHGFDIMALWDMRCNTFDITTLDNTNPEYWKERWELYRINYFGGRWFAERKITQIELYNEPDKNPGCMNGDKWIDDVRIRSRAMQHAFDDHNRSSGDNLTPHLIGPTITVYWRTSYSEPMFRLMHTPFPENTEDPNFTLFHAYSYHKYGAFTPRPCTEYGNGCRSEQGGLMRQMYDKARNALSTAGYGNMEIMLTEFNCFTAATSDNASNPFFTGTHVADMPSTGACLGAQIAHLIKNPGGPNSLNIHRLTQSYNSKMPSKITKNGIMYGSVTEKPFFLTGTTKLGEVYRLIRRKTGRGQQIWKFAADSADIEKNTYFSIFATDDDLAYYLYVTNEEWNPHRVILNLDALPGVDPFGNVIATAVGKNREWDSTYHGEVAFMQPLEPNKVLNYVHPPNTFMMLTVPKVLTQRMNVTAAGDATVRASGEIEGLADNLLVSTADQLAVAVIKFEYDPNSVSEGIVSAVLKLHLRETTNTEPQVVSVIGLPDDWHEESVSWSNLIFLKSAGARVSKTNENFINWWANPQPSIVGHITIPPKDVVEYDVGQFLYLDVTDAVQKGINQFMLVRVFRYDASRAEGPSQLPADNVQGSYFFTSKDSEETEKHPQLVIDYKVNEYSSPPPEMPSPPPPTPPTASPPPSPVASPITAPPPKTKNPVPAKANAPKPSGARKPSAKPGSKPGSKKPGSKPSSKPGSKPRRKSPSPSKGTTQNLAAPRPVEQYEFTYEGMEV